MLKLKRNLISKSREASMLVKNHLLCPYSDCEAHSRQGNLRIQIQVANEEGKRTVNLSQSVKGRIIKTSLPYNHVREEFRKTCPYCNRPIIAIVDETHWGRKIFLKTP